MKVRRRCGDGRKGDGKTWWYKPGQVEEIDDSEEEEEPVEPQEERLGAKKPWLMWEAFYTSLVEDRDLRMT